MVCLSVCDCEASKKGGQIPPRDVVPLEEEEKEASDFVNLVQKLPSHKTKGHVAFCTNVPVITS
jgi:hypothetical protein